MPIGEIIDEHLVHRLITAQFPQWSQLAIRKLNTAGTDHKLYRLGQDKVIRLPRTYAASQQINKEQQWLPRLAPLLPLAIPCPLGLGIPADGYPWSWSIYQWLEGEDATIAPADTPQTALALAEFLSALQHIDPTEGPLPGEHNFFRGVPLAQRDDKTRTAIISLQNIFNADLMFQAWNSSLKAPLWTNSPCWIHGDLIPTNLLVQKGCLTGVIDFGGLSVGDPACDLLIAWTFMSAEIRNIFRSALKIDDATWCRGRGWSLSMTVTALDYYQKTNLVLAGIAKYAIDAVLADFKLRS